MTTYHFSVSRGDDVVPVVIDGADDVDAAAIQAAAAARDMMEGKPFVVSDALGHVGTFSNDDVNEWWA